MAKILSRKIEKWNKTMKILFWHCMEAVEAELQFFVKRKQTSLFFTFRYRFCDKIKFIFTIKMMNKNIID